VTALTARPRGGDYLGGTYNAPNPTMITLTAIVLSLSLGLVARRLLRPRRSPVGLPR
jgi:hypothetical protein